jgi:hypothetical protein
MQSRGWILGALAVAFVAAAATVVAVRDPGGESKLTAVGRSTTTSAPVTSSSTVASSTTTTTATQTAPTSTTIAPPTSTLPADDVTTTSTTEAPPFEASIEPVTAAQLGSSWKPDFGCPAPEQLRAVNVSHWGYDGAVHHGQVIVDAAYADRVVDVFRDIYADRFPIQQMIPIDAYGGDDQASMRANNTSGFNCRYVAGTTTLSQHGLGRAIDVNPLVNPYVKGGTVDPPEGAPYADRGRADQGMIHARDAVVSAFARQGWSWGGYWPSGKDYQHFSATGG